MYRKLVLAALITCFAALDSAPAPAATLPLPQCIQCSDAFYDNGVVLDASESFDTVLTPDAPLNRVATANVPLNLTAGYIFTEPGAGISSTALVSDIVFAASSSELAYISDPFEGLTVDGAAKFFAGLSPAVPNPTVLEETGGPDLTVQFASDVGDPPPSLPPASAA